MNLKINRTAFNLVLHITNNAFCLQRARGIESRRENNEPVGGFFTQLGEQYVIHHLWGRYRHCISGSFSTTYFIRENKVRHCLGQKYMHTFSNTEITVFLRLYKMVFIPSKTIPKI